MSGQILLTAEQKAKLEAVLAEIGATPWAQGYNKIGDYLTVNHYSDGGHDVVIPVR